MTSQKKASKSIKHEPGIVEFTDAKRKKPFMFRQMVDGQSVTDFFATLEEAQAAKKARKRVRKKYGAMIDEFTEKDFLELKQAKALLPEGVTLMEAVLECSERHGTGEKRTLDQCVELFLLDLKEREVSQKYYANAKSNLGKLVQYFPKKLARDVTQEMAMEKLKNLGALLGKRTVANNLATWKSLFTFTQKVLKEIKESPMTDVSKKNLPREKKVIKANPLRLDQVERIMELVEKTCPKIAYWMALQFFVGFREGEASRFRYEWVQPKFRTITMPGWFYDEEGEVQQGSKTGDAWMLDKVPDNFWAWHAKYGKESGPVYNPCCNRDWKKWVVTPCIEAEILKDWPHNAKRDSFCTFHISAFRDAKATALLLKHRGVDTLWNHYMGCMKTEKEGKAYFEIQPKSEHLKLVETA